jgi:sRNA-binding regulator protein Hfq
MTRKLIKPNLNEIKKGVSVKKRKPAPPYKTHAENYYYIKQMNNKTPLVIELVGGEKIKGHIEWYDQSCLKIRKEDGVKIILFKHSIKYLHKDLENISAENQKSNLEDPKNP